MTPIGDFARHAVLQHQSKALRSIVHARSNELATGQVHDLRAKLKGETGEVHTINKTTKLLDAFQSNISETRTLFEMRQRGLDSIRGNLADVVATALSIQTSGGDYSNLQNSARRAFEDVTAHISAHLADRPVFTGLARTETPQSLFEQVSAAIEANPASAVYDIALSEISNALGLEATLTNTANSDVPVSTNRSVQIGDPDMLTSLVETLATVASIALEAHDDSPYPGQEIASDVIHLSDRLVNAQTELGHREAFLDRTEARNAAEQTALNALKSELTGADPFEAATDLQSATLRLETLFAATARISKLSLANYL